MKQKRLMWSMPVLVVVTLVVLACPQNSLLAAERNPGWSSGFNGGVGWFLDGYLSTGFSGRVFLEYAPYIHEIGLKLTGGYLRFTDNVSVGSGSFTSSAEAQYDNWYVTGGGVYRFSRGKIVPFLSGNIGVYRYHKEEPEAGSGPIIDGEQSGPYAITKTYEGFAFGVNGGGGVEFFMSERTSFSLESLVHFTFGDESDQIIDITAMFRFFR